jgi:Zn-finger nucleic acid-binding protein
MKCPIDGATLLMSNRSGIEIDYCPECRGVWLDRGELDKIIEREAAQAQSYQEQAPSQNRQMLDPEAQQFRQNRYDDDDYYNRQKYGNKYDPNYHKKKRKSSFLGDLFEFGD